LGLIVLLVFVLLVFVLLIFVLVIFVLVVFVLVVFVLVAFVLVVVVVVLALLLLFVVLSVVVSICGELLDVDSSLEEVEEGKGTGLVLATRVVVVEVCDVGDICANLEPKTVKKRVMEGCNDSSVVSSRFRVLLELGDEVRLKDEGEGEDDEGSRVRSTKLCITCELWRPINDEKNLHEAMLMYSFVELILLISVYRSK
jgi:energy-coupling factor transporter transmembrane protein EcfT